MSLRNLKKLHQSEIILDQTESDEEEIIRLKTSKLGFDLLSVSEREDDNETENMSANAHKNDQKKKKKKKRRQKSGKSKTVKSSEDCEFGDDEITKTVKEVDKMFGIASSSDTKWTTESDNIQVSTHRSLLSVKSAMLNPQNEMKKMFGKIVQDKKRSQRGGSRTSKPKSKSGIFMTPLAATTSERTATDPNAMYFTFEHSASYRQMQEKFLQSLETSDTNNVIKIINTNPYHVDALIQLSEFFKMAEDLAMSSNLIDHAMVAYESAFHSMFSLTNENCRLDYRRQVNRGFFIVLFKNAQFLSSRACNRTALELAKVLLSLDREDPLAVILVIDYYALRSKQYGFIIDIAKEWERTHNLSQLPNIAYSYALALFLSNKIEQSNDALQYALMMFPGLLKPLMDQLSVQPDKRVDSHKFFGPNAYTNSPKGLQQLISLYVARCCMVWSGDMNILHWLESNVHIVLNRVDQKDEIISEYAAKRNQRYLKPPRNILRHIILSDFKEKVPIAEFIVNESAVFHFDPLPPLDSINLYGKPKMDVQQAENSANGLQLFFQSFLPNFSNNSNGAQTPDLDVTAALENIRDTIYDLHTQLLDAMRMFISDNNIPNPNEDDDIEGNDSSSTDEADVNNYLT